MKISSHPFQPRSLLRVQANLVELRVVVRDADGHIVSGLQQSDFAIYDNGRPQAISFFSAESSTPTAIVRAAPPGPPTAGGNPALPLVPGRMAPQFVALFFDDLHLDTGDLEQARQAAQALLQGGLPAGDQIGVFTASTVVTLDFTGDTNKILEALAKLGAHQKMSEKGLTSCPRIGPYEAYQIEILHDPAVFNVAVEQALQPNCVGGAPSKRTAVKIVETQARETWELALRQSQATLGALRDVVNSLVATPGRRTLVLISSGFLTRTLENEQDAVLNAALDGGVVINSMDARGLVAIVPGGSADQVLPHIRGRPDLDAEMYRIEANKSWDQGDAMALLPEGTGGTFFHNSNDLRRGIRELALPPEVSYLLALSPANLKANGSFHSLKVRLNAPGHFNIQARPGYYAPTKKSLEPTAAERKLEKAIFTTEQIEGIPIEASVLPATPDPSGPILWLETHVDLRRLPFRQRDGRHVQTLTITAALFDSAGKFAAGKQTVVDLALKGTTLRRFSESGFHVRMFLIAPPGSYRLREIVQESMEGRMTARSLPAQIR